VGAEPPRAVDQVTRYLQAPLLAGPWELEPKLEVGLQPQPALGLVTVLAAIPMLWREPLAGTAPQVATEPARPVGLRLAWPWEREPLREWRPDWRQPAATWVGAAGSADEQRCQPLPQPWGAHIWRRSAA
jgi:hypothetical protein